MRLTPKAFASRCSLPGGVPARRVVVTTTAGTKITIPASAATLEKFVDPPSVAAATYGAAGDLANSVQSNFVSIASTQVLDKLKPTPPTALCEKKSVRLKDLTGLTGQVAT